MNPSILVRSVSICALWVLLLGCNESITVLCEDIATKQCSQCTECADSLESNDGPRAVTSEGLCGLRSADESTQSSDESTQSADEDSGPAPVECEVVFTERCEFQASTLEEPGDDLEKCRDAQNAMTCNDVLSNHALGASIEPQACAYFL